MKHHNRLIATICLAMVTFVACAEDTAFDFNIPAQPVSQVIEALTKQTGVQPFFAADSVKDTLSPGVVGHYTLREAVGKALSGTGLTFQFTADNAVAISVIEKGGTLREVVVTAQQRKQREIDVPIKITALDSKEIADRGITDIQSLSFAIPEMTAVVTGMAQNRIMLRGIGEGAGGGQLSLVGVRLDEVAVDGPLRGGLDVRPLDVERVEVLNGPQGTLYGQGSMGGTVRFLTHDPVIGKTSMTAAADVSTTKGGAPSNRFTGVANVSLSDQSALRIAGTFEKFGGWIDAPSAGRTNINDGNLSQVRIKGLFNVTDRLVLTPMVQIHHNTVGSLNNGEQADGTLTLPAFAPTAVQGARNDHELYSLTADWEMMDGIKLLAVVSKFNNNSDGGYYSTTPNGLIGVLSKFDNRDKSQSGELRLMSDNADSLQWTVGSLYRDVDYRQAVTTSQMGLVNSPTPISSPNTVLVTPIKSKSWSTYGNTSFDLTERLQIGGGLRYFTDEQIAPTAGQANQHFNSVDPRVYASFKLQRDWNVYTSAAKGFRSGGFNAVNPAFPASYKPESVWSYEIGTKFEAMDGLFGGQVAGFLSRYTDMQTSTLLVGTLNTFYTDNVGRANIQGVDWKLRLRPADWATVGVSGTVQSTEVVSVKAGSAYAVGDRLNYMPKSNYAIFVETKTNLANDIKASFRADYNIRGSSVFFQRTYNATATNETLKLLNMSLALSQAQYRIELYGENLLNDRGQTFPNPVNFATRTVPRTIGIRGATSF